MASVLAKKTLQWLVFLAMALPVQPGLAQVPQLFNFRLEPGLIYTPSTWPQSQQGDLYLPLGQGPFPVVLLVHGGSWQHGQRNDMDAIARQLVARGYAAFTVDYRLAPQSRFPAQLQDLQQAVLWLRQHADNYWLDDSRVSGWGFSAGAHLISLLGTLSPDDALSAPGTRLQAVVGGGTPADLRKYPNSPSVTALLGVNGAGNPALYAEASPVVHATRDDPPFFLYHGTADTLVEPEQALGLQAALRQAGVPVRFYSLKGYGHVSTALFAGKAVGAGIDFLDEYLGRQGGGEPAHGAAAALPK